MSDLDELKALHERCGCSHVGLRCSKHDCALVIAPHNAGTAVCIDCDRCNAFPEDAKKPDLVVLTTETSASPSRWLVVEMKSRAADGRDIVRQLQAGADVIASHPSFAVSSAPDDVTPIVLHRRGLKAAARDVINTAGVQFKGQRCRIRTGRCGVAIP